MNKEQEQIIDVAYNKWIAEYWNNRIYPNQNDKEQFINKCKTNPEFSEKWGLKIEERELSDKERVAIFMENKRTNKFEDNNCDIPTKLITLTYNNETIESYE